ncbi:SGNH/GDSL hydrolase family protein [Actinomadura miaoliensis]|uniref:SGNH/GDSL hydrolase family protein n=1 Tax=Actinomadura miaoliensis TaxID=430685 RepID=A0ABP7X731_9ACTN
MNPLLLPVIAAQGIWVRSRTERLPEASGPAEGSVGDGSGPPLRIAVLGESTAAGCGVGTHDEGFAAALARELAARAHRPVTWAAVGRNSATAHVIRHRLLPRLPEDLDAAVLLAGVNDVLTRRAPAAWGEDLAAIVSGLHDRAAHVAVAGIPPFEAFSSLPAALGRYLAQRADALDAVSRRICAGRPRTTWINSAGIVPVGPDFFARDRFHPSAEGYRRWAQAAADHIAV